MCGCTVGHLVPKPSQFGQNCLKQNAGCLEKRQHLGPTKHAQTKYLPHSHVACNKLHTTPALIKKSLLITVSLIENESKYTSVCTKSTYNTLQKTKGPSRTYHQHILCPCTGYPPIRTSCITNTKNELAPN